jgi:hypothetical protein
MGHRFPKNEVTNANSLGVGMGGPAVRAAFAPGCEDVLLQTTPCSGSVSVALPSGLTATITGLSPY